MSRLMLPRIYRSVRQGSQRTRDHLVAAMRRKAITRVDVVSQGDRNNKQDPWDTPRWPKWVLLLFFFIAPLFTVAIPAAAAESRTPNPQPTAAMSLTPTPNRMPIPTLTPIFDSDDDDSDDDDSDDDDPTPDARRTGDADVPGQVNQTGREPDGYGDAGYRVRNAERRPWRREPGWDAERRPGSGQPVPGQGTQTGQREPDGSDGNAAGHGQPVPGRERRRAGTVPDGPGTQTGTGHRDADGNADRATGTGRDVEPAGNGSVRATGQPGGNVRPGTGRNRYGDAGTQPERQPRQQWAPERSRAGNQYRDRERSRVRQISGTQTRDADSDSDADCDSDSDSDADCDSDAADSDD